jgi:transcription initiation factor TFIIIB Brf1 subunit/transcription initiation factor TFIIB
MNLNDCIIEESFTNFEKLVLSLKSLNLKRKEIAAYALYEILLKNGVGKTVEEVSFYTEVPVKALWRIEAHIKCNYVDCASNYLEKFCYFNNLSRRDAAQIRKLLDSSNPENFELLDVVEGCHSPNIAGALIFLHCEKIECSKSMKSICEVCNISVSSVQQIVKKIRSIK